MRFKLFLLLFTFAGINLFAQSHSNEISIQTDNDSYLAQGSDRYYTDGIFIYYRHALKVKSTGSASLYNKILGFETGQKIFNPQSGYITSADQVDRPFAGYLYVGSSLNFLYKNESNLKLSAQLGVVGPASGAQQVQVFVHKLLGFYTPAGWQYQVKNDPELNLSAEYNKLLTRASSFDVSLASYANLGNGFTGAGIGPMFRLGDFDRLFNSESTESMAIRQQSIAPLHKHEFFLYYKPQANVIGYDATVQGGLLEKHNQPNSQEITLNPEPFMFSQQVGVVYSGSRITFDVSAIFHTADVKQMVQSHQWGSVTGNYKFR